MARTGKMICEWCEQEFVYELWNKTRKFCSHQCSSEYAASKHKLKLDDFLNRAKQKYGNKFNYEKVDLENRKNGKIEIICADHGSFWRKPWAHLRGDGGCKLCANNKGRKTLDQFIKEAEQIHGNKYDYSKVNYINCYTCVEIVCLVHGVFSQLPYQHVNLKSGCSECTKIIRISKNEEKWLDEIGLPNDAEHRQVRIKFEDGKFCFVDGFDRKQKIIYEYLGDYWHGNPDKFASHDINLSCKKSFGDLYKETFERFEKLKNMGYTIEHIWESKWLKN